MPLLKFDGTPLDRTFVHAVVLFPSGEHLRERLVAVRRAQDLIKDCAENERVTLSALDVHLVIDSQKRGQNTSIDALLRA